MVWNTVGLKEVEHVATVPATSSSAWTALLLGHMETIQPTIDKWRGTLDTVLLFVALFSSVVTTFYVQAVQGLSEDPAIKTNQLIANLTDIILILHGTDMAKLNMAKEMAPFAPENITIRTTFYWSLALIISISIASIAVTARAFLAKIPRSSHRQAYQKLTELRFRWEHAEKFLGPIIGVLLQGLVVPVLLFIIGLLDTIITDSLPVSSGWRHIVFLCGLISCTVCVCVGLLALYTVTFGSFQSPRSFLDLWRRPTTPISRVNPSSHQPCTLPVENGLSPVNKTVSGFRPAPILGRDSPLENRATDLEAASIVDQSDSSMFVKFMSIFPQSGRPSNQPTQTDEKVVGERQLLAPKHHATYHAIICRLHDDNVLDQAIAALPSLIEERKRAMPRGEPLNVEEKEVETFKHLLSMDASAQCNLLAAKTIVTALTYDHVNRLPVFRFKPSLMVALIDTLRVAAQRNATSGSEMALATLHLLESSMGRASVFDQDESINPHPFNSSFRALCTRAPLLGLLFVPFNELKLYEKTSELDRVRLQVLNFAYDGLVSEMMTRYRDKDKDLTSQLSWYMRDTDVVYCFHDMLRLRLISDTPFLLSLNPVKLGHEMQMKLGSNYDCYHSILDLIFTPDLSQISLNLLARSVCDIVEYHRDHFDGTVVESIDLFMETRDIFDLLNNALDNFIEEKEGGMREHGGWQLLVDTSVLLLDFLFDGRHATLLLEQFSPPLYFHRSIVKTLRQVQKLSKGSSAPVSEKTRAFLSAIEAGDHDFEMDKFELLNAFRMLDPLLPEW
ncbi:hypothetical protein H0H87_001352 [Tephrocybe sp. NHM501043]|nr:hypothetical protein H0H87_001352 [Tephrocybe sp. NHM501043]